MLEALIARARTSLRVAIRSAACAAIACLALVVAVGFFLAAGFLAAQQRFGPLDAALIFGGGFLLIAIVALIVMMVLRRPPRRARIGPARGAGAPAWWLDPQLVARGLELGKLLGGRRATTVSLIGAFIVGVLLSRAAEPRRNDDR